MWDSLVGVEDSTRDRFRAHGWWREQTFLDDLARHAERRPGHPAIIGHDGQRQTRTLTYGDLAAVVTRLAAGLTGLGVGRGDVVVLYLPNVWQLAPLYLACLRIGAVASPVIPTLAGRELEHVVTASGARLCVTVPGFGDADLVERVRAVPGLSHRVVIGASGPDLLDLDDLLVDPPADLPAPGGPDDPVLLLYTSGTAGPMKGVVHSPNTLYAAARAVSVPHGLGADDVICIPNFMTHMAGATYAAWMPVLLGATSVVQHANTDMELLLDLIESHGITWTYASPSYLPPLLEAQRTHPRGVHSLLRITSGSAPVHPDLVAAVREVFELDLHTLWGMTENGTVTVTRPDDPEGWGAHSDGRAEEWMDLRIDPDPETADGAGRLWVRGASQCLGYLDQRDIYESCLDADGWFDTGDLARDDGRGGIRITGRRTDIIVRGNGQKISTLEVESVLRRHPRIKDVALVGYPDPGLAGAELVCAVVVSDGAPTMLEELHDYLEGERMAAVLWPDRVQFVWQLPANAIGKVLRRPLRRRLEIASRPRPGR